MSLVLSAMGSKRLCQMRCHCIVGTNIMNISIFGLNLNERNQCMRWWPIGWMAVRLLARQMAVIVCVVIGHIIGYLRGRFGKLFIYFIKCMDSLFE